MTTGLQWLIRRRRVLLLVGTLTLLFIVYLPTLLTQINGGDNPYMDDVGEIQVALNVWGTIHHTGYPLYAILGNLVVLALRAAGVNPAAAPCLYAMAWGFVALTAFYLLTLRFTRSAGIAAAATFLLGIARSVWIHDVVSEVYSMSFAFDAILLAVALWTPINADNSRRRIWLLALLGGFGVAHHRAVVFIAPGLLLAALPGLWADFQRDRRHALGTVGAGLLLGVIGFIPYVYLPARALAHADWVYGNPGTLDGFWHEFTGAEAAFLFHLPLNGQGWLNDAADTVNILLTELTPLFTIAGVLALLWAMRSRSPYRHQARILFVATLGPLAFLLAFHEVVIPQAVAMPIILILTLALALLLNHYRVQFANRVNGQSMRRLLRYGVPVGFAVLAAVIVIPAQFGFIYDLTHNDTGLQMIALAERVPRAPIGEPQPVLMLPWGPRYDAVGFSKYVTKENADLQIVTHKANFASIVTTGDILYTSKDTFYQFPLSWWDSQIGRAYLSAPADGLVEINTAPLSAQISPNDQVVAHGIWMGSFAPCGNWQTIDLNVEWEASQKPDADLSVFVHLLSADGSVIAQDDRSAPVYGWYPTSRWSAGEVVTDHYQLPRLTNGTKITFGMYDQPTPGKFVNYGTTTLNVPLPGDCKVFNISDAAVF